MALCDLSRVVHQEQERESRPCPLQIGWGEGAPTPHGFPLPGPPACAAPATSRAPRVLVAGVGNELLTDDGVGVYAVRALQQHPLPGVTMVEIGTAVLHGLSFIEAADRVLVIDAAKGGHPPGTLYVFDATANTRDKAVTSIHAMGLREAASFLLAGKPVPPITVLGVEPAALDYQMGLSPALQAALPRVVSLAREILEQWRQGAPGPLTAVLSQSQRS